jgi:hypothetical protein
MRFVRHFSLDEANRALRDITPLLYRLREIHTAVTRARERLDVLWARLGKGEPVLDELTAVRRQIEALTQEAASVLRRLDETGCILRDVEMGLVDFPAVVEGREVFLCWRLGEEAITYWHGIAEGFAGRKPLSALPGSRVH